MSAKEFQEEPQDGRHALPPKRKAIRQRLPFAIALVALVPEAFGAISSADYFLLALLVPAIVVNVIALRQVPGLPVSLEIGALILDALLAGYAGWSHWARGTTAVHYVWFLAAAGFSVAAIVVSLKRRPTFSAGP